MNFPPLYPGIFAVRIIANLGYRDSCRGVFKNYGLLTVPSAYIMDSIMYILTQGDLTIVADVSGRITRRGNDLHLSPRRTRKADCHVTRSGRILFNALPGYLKDLRGDLKIFKRRLVAYLVEGAFYSISEFKGFSGGPG